MKNFFLLFIFFAPIIVFGQKYSFYSKINTKQTSLKFIESELYVAESNKITKYNYKNNEIIDTFIYSDYYINQMIYFENGLAFSSNKGLVVLGSKKKEIKKTVIFPLIKYNEDIFYGGENSLLYRYNIKTYKNDSIFEFKIDERKYWITDIEINKRTNQLIVCAGDIYIFSLEKPNKFLKKIESYNKDFNRISTFNNHLAIWSYYEKKLQYWDNYNNFPYNYKTIIEAEIPYSSNLIFINDSLLLTGLQDSAVIINTKTNKLHFSFPKKNNRNITTVDITDDGEYIATGELDGAVVIWKKKIEPTSKIELNKESTLNIQFKQNESNFISPDLAKNEIENIIQIINDNKSNIDVIEIKGYTMKGTDLDSLIKLSQDRADVVKQKILEDSNIKSSLISAEGYGATNFINGDPYSKENARVVIKIITKDKNNNLEKTDDKNILKEIKEIKSKNASVIGQKEIISSQNLYIYLPFGDVTEERFNSVNTKNITIDIVKEEDDYSIFRLSMWVIKEDISNNTEYSDHRDELIYIKRNVNARLGTSTEYPKLGNKFLKEGYKFFYVKEEVANGNTWYNFYIYGYMID